MMHGQKNIKLKKKLCCSKHCPATISEVITLKGRRSELSVGIQVKRRE